MVAIKERRKGGGPMIEASQNLREITPHKNCNLDLDEQQQIWNSENSNVNRKKLECIGVNRLLLITPKTFSSTSRS